MIHARLGTTIVLQCLEQRWMMLKTLVLKTLLKMLNLMFNACFIFRLFMFLVAFALTPAAFANFAFFEKKCVLFMSYHETHLNYHAIV